jgi:serine-type D-Ala-D-Ala carboxypeptidase/endopeptidase (penicillin-binding protein 4)
MRSKQWILIISLLWINFSFAQTIKEKLETAIAQFGKDPQLENAIFSLYVKDAKTGAVLLDKNGTIGLATASCLKVVTSAAALELLGSQYQFATKLLTTGTIDNGILKGNLIIQASGDPTLGSWRWEQTKTTAILQKIIIILQKNKITTIEGKIILMDGFSRNVTPSNWIWEDLGNYYGAPARLLNWRENQYDLHFATGKTNKDKTTIVEIDPELPDVELMNTVTTAEAGTGDNSVIYLPPFGTKGLVKGTLPANENNFIVSGAMPNPSSVFGRALISKLNASKIKVSSTALVSTTDMGTAKKDMVKVHVLDTILSPTMDKIVYWFMKKSINLYGEALLNKIGELKQNNYQTNTGVTAIKKFWEQKGIDDKTLNIYDGSGLSPANRITTKTLVAVLEYAQKQPWFASYYDAFPVYNEMKLKSGTIGDVKGFTGYHTAADGNQYLISFLVNNYNGSTKAVVGKMFKVLDVLK